MNYDQLFAPARARPVRCALLGCGEFGLSLIAQTRALTGLDVVAALDRDVDTLETRLAAAGLTTRRVSTPAETRSAALDGELAITDDISALLADPIEMVIEATGHAEAGAAFAEAAIASGIGVAMVSKEAECVVGPILAHKARERNVPYTLVHGDQPALLIALLSWCRLLGLPVVAAGKSSEYDYVYDAAAGTLTWTHQTEAVGDLTGIWTVDGDVAGRIGARSDALSAFPHRTVPDFCEMALVANATGLKPDRPDFHAPFTRSAELADVYRPRADGGLLENEGILDVFNCLRRPDEASFAGGVFAVVRWPDAATGALLRGKGIPTTADDKYGLVYNPSHLLGVEAPMSVMAAARLDNTMVDDTYRPVVDLTAIAEQPMSAGTRLEIVGNRHVVPGLEPRLTPATAIGGAAPLPYYLAVGCELARDLSPGDTLTTDHVIAPEGSRLWALRREQDSTFNI
jgi:predicted homoserine dehydrogenase-like protein